MACTSLVRAVAEGAGSPVAPVSLCTACMPAAGNQDALVLSATQCIGSNAATRLRGQPAGACPSPQPPPAEPGPPVFHSRLAAPRSIMSSMPQPCCAPAAQRSCMPVGVRSICFGARGRLTVVQSRAESGPRLVGSTEQRLAICHQHTHHACRPAMPVDNPFLCGNSLRLLLAEHVLRSHACSSACARAKQVGPGNLVLRCYLTGRCHRHTCSAGPQQQL